MSTTIQEGSALADELLQQIGETVGDRAKASTIFGEPVEREGITLIPVAKAKFGFGGGGGKRKHGPGRGGGGGAAVSPLGYIELRDGTAQFKPITRPTELLAVVAAASLLTLALTRLSAEFQRITRRRRRSWFARRSRSGACLSR
jgi:uncharacterized spore protein YtfJ